MPYPGKITARNASFDGHWDAIDEDFVNALHELVPTLLAPNNLTIKTVNGVTVKAFELSVYIKQYVNLFKSENLPEAKTIYESTLDNQFQILMSKAVEVYLESIQLYQSKIKNFDEILALHNVSKAISLKYFDEEKKYGNEQETQTYRVELNGKLEKAYDEWKPITRELLNKIKVEQEEAEKHKALAEVAKVKDENAKKELSETDKKYKELQSQLQLARYDSEESRREAAELKRILAKVEQERKQALEREIQTRRQYEEQRQRAYEIENQLVLERQKATHRLQERVVVIRKRDGILQFFDAVGYVFASISRGIQSALSKLVFW
jgi:hypothetical protein